MGEIPQHHFYFVVIGLGMMVMGLFGQWFMDGAPRRKSKAVLVLGATIVAVTYFYDHPEFTQALSEEIVYKIAAALVAVVALGALFTKVVGAVIQWFGGFFDR